MNKKGRKTLNLGARHALVSALVVITVLCTLLTSLSLGTFAEGEQVSVNAELSDAYGGAASIATMTFDDGLPETSALLNELMKEYGFKASLALVSSHYVDYDNGKNPISTTGNRDFFADIFAEGYLSPISHSRDHKNLAISSGNPLTIEQVTEYAASEVDGSLIDLNYAFPESDVLAYAIPSSWCESVVFDNIKSNFYASRGGYCVLTISPGEMQSLDPAQDLSVGGWYQPYSIRMMPEQYDDSVISVDKIIDYLDACVENKGWFISTAHAIVGYDTSRGNQDITLDGLTKILDAMKVYSNSGELWVTDYNSAIKYIRERQNSTVSAYRAADATYVTVTMASTTPDGLPLSADVFNHPLTVKVEVPSDWSSVSYKLGSEDKTASCFTEGEKRYAYVDAVPNSGAVKVTKAALPEGITYGVWASEADYLAGKMPVTYSTEPTLDTLLIATDGEAHLAIENEKYATEGFIPGYVRLYSNLTSNGKVVFVGGKQNLVLDLAGYTLTTELGGGFTVGRNSYMQYPDCSLTVKNGTYIVNNGQIIGRPATSIYFDDVTFNVYKYTQDAMCYDVGALLRYTDCTINLTNECCCYETSASGGRIEFIRTSITQKYANPRPLFWVKPGAGDMTITFDKDCSISREGNTLLGIASDATEGINVKLLFELGTTFSRGAIPDMTYFSATNYDKAGTFVPATDTIGKVLVTENGFDKECEDYYFVKNSDGLFKTTSDLSSYKIIEWANGTEKIAVNTWTEPHIDGNPDSTNKVLMTENGSTIKLYDDITYGQISTFYNYSLTFDLNGHTMTSSSSTNIELGRGTPTGINDNLSGDWMEDRVIRFTSSNGKGALVTVNNGWAAFHARPGTSVYFENLDITTNRYMFNDGGAKLVSFENCTLWSQGEKAIIHSSGVGGGAENKDRHLIIDNTVLKRTPLAELYMSFADRFTYTVRNNSVIDNSIWMVYINGGSSPTACTRTLNIDVDTRFTRSNLDYLLSIPESAAALNKVNISWFDGIDNHANPGTALNTESYAAHAGGKLTVGTLYEDLTYYCFRERPTISDALKANLTLKTNFNLNFFADPDVIKGIYLGSTALDSTKFEGRDKYTVPFAAHEAANELTFTVVALLDGEEYEITINYSVLAYAEALMKTDAPDSAKDLVKAAIGYVKEAYAYAKLTDPSVVAPEALLAFNTDLTAVENTAAPANGLTEAISGSQLKLDSAVKLVLNLDSSFSGTLTVDGVSYTVTNGALADGSTSILIEMRAKDLFDTAVVIEANGDSAEFTLASYANSSAVSASSAKALVDALYTYTYYANAYIGE